MLVLGKFRMLGLRFRGFGVFMGLRHIGYVVLGFLLGILRAHTHPHMVVEVYEGPWKSVDRCNYTGYRRFPKGLKATSVGGFMNLYVYTYKHMNRYNFPGMQHLKIPRASGSSASGA